MMHRQQLRIAVVATCLTAAAVSATAQESPRTRVRARAGNGTMIITNGERTDTIRLGERRGRLGITVDMRPDASRDSIGALVAGLTTPDGAAARAGVQVGDIITRFNGTALPATDRGSDEGEGQSRPAMRLINLASRLDPGDTVRLDIRRGTQNVNATLVAGESDMDMMVEHMRMPGMEFGARVRPDGPEMPGMPGWEGQMRTFVFGGPIADLELVKVNPGLGEYFGTQEGLLVVSVGDDSALGLRAGDVILSIGGRRPASPPQAMRILGTYEPNEAVQFDVMRQRHRLSVSGKIPRGAERGWSVRHNNFEFEPFRMEMEMPDVEMMIPRMNLHPRHSLIRISGEV